MHRRTLTLTLTGFPRSITTRVPNLISPKKKQYRKNTSIYNIRTGNLHTVNSWGTRETEPEMKKEDSKHKPEREETGYFCSLGNFLR
jgi:hypothetical protein